MQQSKFINLTMLKGATRTLTANQLGFSSPSGYYMLAIRSFGIVSRYINVYAVAAGNGDNSLIQFSNVSDHDITNATGVLHMVFAPTAYRTVQELPDFDCSNL